jgi:hypothetical protein
MKKEVKRLEKVIADARNSERLAIEMLRTDASNKLISATDAMIEKANINADSLRQVAVAEATIKGIYPSWTSSAQEIAERAVVGGSEKVGELAGKVLKTPIQSAIGFGKKFWNGAKQEVNTAKEGLLSK